MDDLDQRLLGLLRANSRESVATLAKRLGVSRGTVNNRIARLEAENVIVGYTVRLRPETESVKISAWMSIVIDGNETRRVISVLLGEPGVAALHDTNGRWDLLAELQAQSIAEMSAILERVRLIKGIAATETSLHLRSYKAG